MSGGMKKMREHISAVKNIQKITSSMKSVSSSKFARSEKKLKLSRHLGEAAKHFYVVSSFKVQEAVPHTTLVAVSSDRGLCGAMHTKVCGQVLKFARSYLKENKSFDIVCLGEKSKFILSFEYGTKISMVVNGIGHTAPTFSDASKIVSRVFGGDPYMQGNIVFPLFKNMAEFNVSSLWVYSMPFILSTTAILSYEYEHEEFPSFLEFSQVVLLYFALCETYLVELAQRISAMSNASRNANEMTSKLALVANRKRQQMVTTELSDIVSGAAVISSK
ncbi:ATP synthase subunit gamma, mitochondrial [Halyomorpha halys]|uniref:ATP synthase subunit gamma, mitochondrial n=1 Tax=Halyomorpha halys TaxID=286706 RepID=UPI0006D4D96E|nr:ATP synthase subunit gamma, mitochondrial-like [Halyomorpha halys]